VNEITVVVAPIVVPAITVTVAPIAVPTISVVVKEPAEIVPHVLTPVPLDPASVPEGTLIIQYL